MGTLAWGLAAGLVAAVAAGWFAWQAWRQHRQPHLHLYSYLQPGSRPQGPVDLTRLRAMLADGRLGADALIAPAGNPEWRPVSGLLGEPVLSPARAGAP